MVDKNSHKIEWDRASIELDSEGWNGVLYAPNDNMPFLLAYRPQVSRFLRLCRILGATRALVSKETGLQGLNQLNNALIALADQKGDFTAIWHKEHHRDMFNEALGQALSLEDEDPEEQLLHLFDDQLGPLKAKWMQLFETMRARETL